MAARLSNGDFERVALPVSRYDIADYLGVSVETRLGVRQFAEAVRLAVLVRMAS